MKLYKLFIFSLLFLGNVQAQNSRDSLLNKLNTLLNANTVEARSTLLDEATKLKHSDNEDDLVLANKVYKELGKEIQYNELRKYILKKYPKGITSRQNVADEFLKQLDKRKPKWVEKQYTNWLKKFPVSNFEPKNRGTYDMVLMQLVKHFLATEQHHLVDKYKNTFIEQSLKTMTYYSIAEDYFKQEDFKQAKHHIDSALMWSDQSRQSTDMKVRSSFGAMMYNNIALLAAQVDLKQGNPNTALRLLPDILSKTKYQPMHGETMIFTLANAYKSIGADLDAFLALKNYAMQNEDIDKVWGEIQALYKDLNGQDANFEQLKNSIEDAKNEKHLQNLKEKLVKIETPNFELHNLAGQTVKLSDYKGKIVILDFWATWCVPCIRSFPAMQQLVNNSKNSDDVAFLFINTWEKQKNFKQAVQDFMSTNSYTFHVLFDEISEKNNTLLANQLNIPSLPTKVLIDKDGYMRIMVSGSDTNDIAIIKEVENLIKIGKDLE